MHEATTRASRVVSDQELGIRGVGVTLFLNTHSTSLLSQVRDTSSPTLVIILPSIAQLLFTLNKCLCNYLKKHITTHPNNREDNKKQ